MKKPALVFGSYGWSGEAVGVLKTRLEGLKFNVYGDGFRVNFMPSEKICRTLAYVREFWHRHNW